MTTQARTADSAAALAGAHRQGFSLIPRTADGWSCFLSGHAIWLMPAWFWAANAWNPVYEPHRPWVWSVPWVIALFYLSAQLLLLLKSLQRSEEIGIWDMSLAIATFVSSFGTALVLIVLSILGAYTLTAFTGTFLFALFLVMLVDMLATIWMRLLVNRRSFVAAMGPDSSGSS